MPNSSSRAGHVPERTCVICRQKGNKKTMIRFILSGTDLIIDWRKKLSQRGYYSCNDNNCIILLDKWLKKKSRKAISKTRKK